MSNSALLFGDGSKHKLITMVHQGSNNRTVVKKNNNNNRKL